MVGAPQLAGVILYCFVFMMALFLLYYIVSYHYFELKSPHSVFLFLLLAFLACRIFWFSMNYQVALYPPPNSQSSTSTWTLKDSTYTMTRIAFCFFFAALSSVLYKWVLMIEIVQSTSHAKLPDADWIPTLMITCNVLFSLAIVVNIFYYALFDKGREGTLGYDSSIFFIANFDLVALIAFFVWGIRLYWVASQAVNQKLMTVAVLGSIFFACFVIRFAMLLYRPVTGNFLPEGTFTVLTYFVPELIPMCSQMTIIARVTSLKRQKNDR